MKHHKLYAIALFALAATALLIGSIAIAQQSSDAKPAAQQKPQLPHGWTEEDMKAAMEAGTPGKMHEHLAKSVGKWQGKCTTWMAPGAEPTTSECSATVTPIFDGRFTKCEWEGEMPGLGPYKGFGVYGYDNVAKKFVAVWIDNHSTGLMKGEGELSPDGKTTTLEYTFNCPITRKPMKMVDVETLTGPNSKTLEMTSTDPKTGKEFKMMSVELTRKEGRTQAGG